MLCVEELTELELFQKLPHERLEWICKHTSYIELAPGDILVQEGAAHKGFLILMAGKIGITRYSEGVEMPIGQHDAPSFFGEIQIMTDDLVPVTLRALSPCRVYELANEDFLQILHEHRDFERVVFRTLQTRIMQLQSFIQNREKMASLGTLAAGLAHELNNPATAVVRGLKDIIPALLELQRMNLVYGQRNIEESHTERWLQVRDDGYDFIVNGFSDPLEMIEREELIMAWLEDYGVAEPWKLAEPIAAGNVEIATLEELMARWRDDPTEFRDMGLRWLALSFEVMTMIQAGLQGAERVSQIVQSMRSYSHLDQGAKQQVDIHQGIEDTLQLMSFRLKQGVTVHRNYDGTIPQIMAFGSELNQVWTNLIDNSIDAMDEHGDLTIVTLNQGDRVEVKIIDSGSGIPQDIQSRIFEPFFTTKPVGKGSGLGLDNVRRIVENRHRGSLALESEPGKTCFIVCLPIDICKI
ncbi:MAG: ATP-binding protein [Cyanobacteria bacterium J06621_8]